MPGCDGGWSLGHIPVTSTPGSSLSHWRSWPSSISWGGAVRTGETFKDCSSGPAIKSLTCSLTLETCELSFEVTVKVSRLIWHFSSALDANYNCCDERFCNHQDHCVSITFITMTNVNTDRQICSKFRPPGQNLCWVVWEFCQNFLRSIKRWQKKSQPETELWAAVWNTMPATIQTE